jgi:hypothetical protein
VLIGLRIFRRDTGFSRASHARNGNQSVCGIKDQAFESNARQTKADFSQLQNGAALLLLCSAHSPIGHASGLPGRVGDPFAGRFPSLACNRFAPYWQARQSVAIFEFLAAEHGPQFFQIVPALGGDLVPRPPDLFKNFVFHSFNYTINSWIFADEPCAKR